jgi:hypothetical protein
MCIADISWKLGRISEESDSLTQARGAVGQQWNSVTLTLEPNGSRAQSNLFSIV